jgi:hypothetical protein
MILKKAAPLTGAAFFYVLKPTILYRKIKKSFLSYFLFMADSVYTDLFPPLLNLFL